MSGPAEETGGDGGVRALVVLVITAVCARLLSLQWLHPLQWDEVEYFRATDWVSRGFAPYRDFWEHHTPLQWFVFAPFAALNTSEGVGAVIAMRWAQLPVWIATFWLLATWMRRAGLPRASRWAVIALACGSALFMIPAVEYRIDTLGCALFVAGLVLAQQMSASRGAAFCSGICFAAAGLANLRLGPLLAITVVLLRIVDGDARRWRNNERAQWVWGGVAAALAAAAFYFVITGSAAALYQQVWVENYLGDRYGTYTPAAFVHRLLMPFGVRLLGGARPFDPMGIDLGGVVVVVAGSVGMIRSLGRWRTPDWLFVLAVLQVVNCLFIAKMKNVYVYHFEIVVLLMLPLIAGEVTRLRRLRPVLVAATVVVVAASFSALFRGKEMDRAYQDRVMREVHARTSAGERVFDGVGWAIRREPAYRFWFLPDLSRQLVRHGGADDYALAEAVASPPAAVIADQNAILWMSQRRDLTAFLTRHYVPVWRNLWLPGMSALVPPGGRFEWIVPRDGTYRPLASGALTAHAWFAQPLLFASDFGRSDARDGLRLPDRAEDPRLTWQRDAQELPRGGSWSLRRGQRLTVVSAADVPLAVFALPVDVTSLFRQPAVNVSIDGAAPRETHFPQFGARLED